MPRVYLSKDDIKELASLLSEVFEHLATLRSENVLAEHIQYPKIPSILSESLIIHLLGEKRLVPGIDAKMVAFGGREADIVVETNSGRIIRIEAKATGESAFEFLGEKDIASDYLVWVHFGDFFIRTERGAINIFVVENPHEFFNKPVKITLRRFQELIGSKLQRFSLKIDEL